MSTAFQKFKIKSTLEYTADHFELSFTGSEPFRNKTTTDTVTLTIGFLDSFNVPQTIISLDGGFTDEFQITLTPKSITGVKNGRDQGFNALDKKFNKRYYRFPQVPPPVPPPVLDSFGHVIPPIPFVTGQFKASQIAAEAAAHAGLSLSWGCPDYQILSTFFASGRVIDTIRKLVRPFTFVAPFQADIFIEGNVLVIRPRLGLNPAPNYTITMANMKRESATFRVRKTQRYGLVTLIGSANALNQTGNVFVEGQIVLVDTQESFSSDGELLSRVVTTSTYSTPSKNLLEMIKETYTQASEGGGGGVFLTRRDTTENDWEPVLIDTAGPVTQKKHIAQSVQSEGFDDNGNWTTLERTETGYAYDGNGFELGETTVVSKLDQNANPPQLVPDSMTIKTMRDIATLITEQTTEVYQFTNEATSQFSGTFQSSITRPVLVSRDTQQQAGTRPGGPGRARPLTVGNDGGQQAEVSLLISTDPFSVDVQESVPDLTRAQCITILQQFQQASYVWQYEAIFQGVNMPWIQRGQYLQITGILAEDGTTPIVLPTMLVLEVEDDYDESVQHAKSVANIRCIGWSTT
jgi:hypothetical protein